MLIDDRILTVLEEHPGEPMAYQVLCDLLCCDYDELMHALQRLLSDAVPMLCDQASCQLVYASELWSCDLLYTYLDTAALDFYIHRRYRVASTSDWALSCIQQDGFEEDRLHIFLCEVQTQGRGRYGRVWRSSFAASLCVSYVWFSQQVFSLSSLTVMLAYTVLKALEAMGYSGLSVKWPNDLMFADMKCGGILVEKQGPYYVIGLGLNLVPQPDVAALSQALSVSTSPSRHALLAGLSLAIRDGLCYFQSQGFAYASLYWQAYQHWYHQYVRFCFPDGVCVGRVVGIDHMGFLILQHDSGRIHACAIGDVKGCLVEDLS